MTPLARTTTAAGALVLAAGAVALAVRWVDSAAVPVVVAQSALPVVGCAVALTALALLLVHRWWALVGLALVVAFAATGLPAVRPATVAASDRDLVVVAANLQYGHGSPREVMAQVERLHADVVVLVEVTEPALVAMEREGLSRWPSQTGIPLPGASGLVVRSHLPIAAIDWGEGYPGPWAAATGRMTTPAGPVVVRGVHTQAPNLREAGRWHASMADVALWSQERHRDEPVIMAGDFNAGFGHPAFRRVAQGWTDAHRAAGAGWVRTWPVGGMVPAFTQLDHVLVRGLDVVDAGTFRVAGTDHAAVWARLRQR